MTAERLQTAAEIKSKLAVDLAEQGEDALGNGNRILANLYFDIASDLTKIKRSGSKPSEKQESSTR